QPGKQRLVDHRAPGAGKSLVEMMMGVDQPRQRHVLAGVEGAVDGRGGRLAGSEQFGNHAVFDNQPAGSVLIIGSEDGEGSFNPSAGGSHRRLLLKDPLKTGCVAFAALKAGSKCSFTT